VPLKKAEELPEGGKPPCTRGASQPLAGQGASGTTRARKLAAIREFSRFREDENSVAANLSLEVAMPKNERVARGRWLWTLAEQDGKESAPPGSPEVQTLQIL
jgi:hypothetical protein